jgi:hypothetical protein
MLAKNLGLNVHGALGVRADSMEFGPTSSLQLMSPEVSVGLLAL